MKDTLYFYTCETRAGESYSSCVRTRSETVAKRAASRCAREMIPPVTLYLRRGAETIARRRFDADGTRHCWEKWGR